MQIHYIQFSLDSVPILQPAVTVKEKQTLTRSHSGSPPHKQHDMETEADTDSQVVKMCAISKSAVNNEIMKLFHAFSLQFIILNHDQSVILLRCSDLDILLQLM